jgi:hypothetical protein
MALRTRKMSKASDLARRGAFRSGDQILIVCEGKKKELNYLNGFCRFHRLHNVKAVACGKGTDPINIVKHAFQLGKERPELDEIICVFDHDNREAACQEAIELVKNHKSKIKYKVILSIPSFELWLLLHFTYTTKSYPWLSHKNRSAVEEELLKHYPNYSKGAEDVFTDCHPKLDTAIGHAKKLKAENNQTGSKSPSTDVHDLMKQLISLV